MKLSHLVWREIAHRKLSFSLALLSVVVAVAASVCALTVLRSHRLHTQERILAVESETQQRVDQMESDTAQRVIQVERETADRVKSLDDEIRKITKNMGFNILILPKDQNLAEFYADDFAAKTMPEEHVYTLAKSRDMMTVNHLRPALIRKLEWPEEKRQIILMGVRGVVPFAHRTKKKPLALPVPEGKIDLGSVLAQQIGLAPGDEVTLLGEKFEVNKINEARGNKDDITVWIDLPKAQELLELEGRINMIQALECNCATIDRLAEIQSDVAGVLGGEVQVVELATKAIARAKARNQVKAEGQANLERVKVQGVETLASVKSEGAATVASVKTEGQAAISQLEQLAAIAIPLVIVAAGLLVGMLSLANVRARRQEIGILRAIGVRSRQILTVFLAKPALVGVLGAAIGYLLGFAGSNWIDSRWLSQTSPPLSAHVLFLPAVLIVSLLMTPILTVMAGWLPALQAAGQDPAQVLHEE